MFQKKVPAVLCRYHKSSDWKYLFEEKTIRFTPLAEFNDPFEGKPATNLVFTTSDNIINRYNEFYNKKLKKDGFPLPPAQGISELLEKQAMFFLESNHILKKNEVCMRNRFYNRLTKGFGAFCLTNNKNNILMWSHYADSHRGFVVGFDVKDLIFNINENININLYKIVYSNVRPCITVGDIFEQDKSISCFNKSVLTKSTLWEYEQEWRAIVSLIGKNKLIIDPIQPLHPSSIKSVVFGMSMPIEEIRNKCRSLRKMSEYSHINLKRAVMDDKEYSVRIKNINDSFF